MNHMRCTAILVGLFLVAVNGIAQPGPQIGIDYASFAYDDQESLVELYMAFEANSLAYVTEDSIYRSVVPLALKLSRSSDVDLNLTSDTPVWSQENNLNFSLRDTSAIREGQVFLRQIRLTVPPGEYELEADLSTLYQDPLRASRDLIIPDYNDQDRCLISDITLASKIMPSNDREDPFYKNGLYILPNANQLYGEGSENLFYYAEAYGTQCVDPVRDEYTLLSYITEANRSTSIPGLQKRSKRSSRPTDILVGSFDLGSLNSGTYFLRMVILNHANEAMVEQSRKFFVFNPQVDSLQTTLVSDAVTFETSTYASMPVEEVENGLAHLRVIATDQESRRIKRVKDLDERRRLLMDLWNVRDPTPATGVNEFRDEFYSLLMYANERYSAQRVEGWETDRGNVLLRYGRPTVIESHMYERGLKPYEVWKYNNIPGEGQADFVFADLDGFGDFELIHSSVAGERKLPNWIQRISNSF